MFCHIKTAEKSTPKGARMSKIFPHFYNNHKARAI